MYPPLYLEIPTLTYGMKSIADGPHLFLCTDCGAEVAFSKTDRKGTTHYCTRCLASYTLIERPSTTRPTPMFRFKIDRTYSRCT